MTLIVDALARVARQVSIAPPSDWVAATDDTYAEIRDDFLLETITDLQKRVDWAAPVGKQTTITGDGSEDYSLPSDFLRLKNDRFRIYETANARRVGTPVQSDGEWTHLKAVGSGGGERFYRLKGYQGNWQLSLYPNPSASETITVSYVSDLWMADSSGGTAGSAFTLATDVLLFPRRPVELGTVFRWRRRKGMDYTDSEREYETWIATESNRTNTVQSVTFGETPSRRPWDVPIPAFIPAS